MESPDPWIRPIRKTHQLIEMNYKRFGINNLYGDNFAVEIYESEKKLNFKIDLSNNLSSKKKGTVLYYDAENLIKRNDDLRSISISDEASVKIIQSHLSDRHITEEFTAEIEMILKETTINKKVSVSKIGDRLEFVVK